MDWRAQAYERLRSEESFKGKSRPEPKKSPCRVLSFFGDTTICNEELVEWLEGLEETETRDTESQETEPEDTEAQEIKAGEIELQSHQDGFRLLLCGRPESANSRANFFNIPVKKNISKDASHRGDPTARDDPAQGQYSPTQDAPAKGAHKEYDIRDILKRFPAHLLLPAVFFELQRHRLKDIRKSHTKDAIELQDNFEELRDFKNGRRAFEFRYQPLAVSECANRLSKLCTDSNVMAEDLRIASRQLNTLKRHAENLAEIQDKELEKLKEGLKELKKPKKVKESPGVEPSNSNDSSSDKPLSVEPPTDEQMKSAMDNTQEMKSTLDNTRCFLDLFNEIAEDVDLVSGAVTVNAKAATVTADEVTSTPPTSRPQE
ncbi:hypothetical protein CDV36_006437 [Fusarium kuroshium]|uniref:Uncharacterized protein n=1 Tax=Fusarium kuroshium TaxID=2010991 RepID=A0A3M2S8L6_9HYPO|nr:hypothetical protein CDV36_006437 [Fusarium kuroshium]